MLKKAGLDLVGLLHEEVGNKRESLVERFELKWSILVTGEDDEEFKNNLRRDIEEKEQKVRKRFQERRCRKWENLARKDGRTPNFSGYSIITCKQF